MKRRLSLFGIAAGIVLLAIAACSADQRETLRRFAALPTVPTETPAVSVLASATSLPAVSGPMGTLTAIADLVASPTQDSAPYVIVNRGNPHFIEFHAWW